MGALAIPTVDIKSSSMACSFSGLRRSPTVDLVLAVYLQDGLSVGADARHWGAGHRVIAQPHFLGVQGHERRSPRFAPCRLSRAAYRRCRSSVRLSVRSMLAPPALSFQDLAEGST